MKLAESLNISSSKIVFLNTRKLIETKPKKKKHQEHFKNHILRSKFNYRCLKPLFRMLQNFDERYERRSK